jgi:hypothetical protein
VVARKCGHRVESRRRLLSPFSGSSLWVAGLPVKDASVSPCVGRQYVEVVERREQAIPSGVLHLTKGQW